MGKTRDKKDSHDKVSSSIGSILFSVFLVALAIGFVFGFKYFLSGDVLIGPDFFNKADEDQGDSDEVMMEKDNNFKYEYVVIQDLNGKEIKAVKDPRAQKDDSGKTAEDDNLFITVGEGQILKVNMRGYIDGTLYYQLENGCYLKDNKSIMPLKEYVELTGDLAITYISSSGVRLRKWPDFDADNNTVSSVYVGDKVPVRAKIITVTDVPAFVTTDGLYITTNSRYLNDHTKPVEEAPLEYDITAEEADETSSVKND
jgi:hypothetical protein